MKNSWIDVSRKLFNGMPVWPGDQPFEYELSAQISDESVVNIGRVTMSTHTGTHVDAPYHFLDDGSRIIDLDINLFIGDVLVVKSTGRESVTASWLNSVDLSRVTRVFIRTDSWTDPNSFPENFTYINPEVAQILGRAGVRLLGVDVPSVDEVNSKDLLAQRALAEQGITILEGLDLSLVEQGMYEMVALPLALEVADGSPVRVALRSQKHLC